MSAAIPEATDSSREIVSTRVFDVPRERLFDAYADPAQLQLWWGPKGFTNTFEHFDFRPGGEWQFTMHAPDGAEYKNTKTFLEIVRPERIIFQHHGPMHAFRMTHLLAEEGHGTRLTWRMLFETPEEVTKLKSFITAANEENFDRLQNHLQTTP